ncbi:M48 family metallopeptidase [Alphaproteobacteria bacterium]|nr:M48 family metallopeptidase [Alphaproteobacteria bacterium]
MKRSTRAKRISLRLDNKDRVFVLTVPKRCSAKQAQDFALTHEEWMQEKLEELPESVPFVHGSIIPILGYNRELEIFYNKSLKATDIVLRRNRLTVYTNREDPTQRIVRFLKSLAKETMEEIAYERAARIRKTINNLYVRDTKTRWGSCSSDGNISLSWRLIFAPFEAMDYVVSHEVAHLKHLDHSPRFWALCRELSDDYENGHYWMKHYGPELMRFG